jgi:hypothetical protein
MRIPKREKKIGTSLRISSERLALVDLIAKDSKVTRTEVIEFAIDQLIQSLGKSLKKAQK